MGTLGKVLLFVNLLAAGGLTYFATQDWAKRQDVTAAAVRLTLVLKGLPTDAPAGAADKDSAGVPLGVETSGGYVVETVRPSLLAAYFQGAEGDGLVTPGRPQEHREQDHPPRGDGPGHQHRGQRPGGRVAVREPPAEGVPEGDPGQEHPDDRGPGVQVRPDERGQQSAGHELQHEQGRVRQEDDRPDPREPGDGERGRGRGAHVVVRAGAAGILQATGIRPPPQRPSGKGPAGTMANTLPTGRM